MEPVEDGRKLQEAEVLETNKGTFVVTHVGYNDDEEGNHVNFNYGIKSPEDIIAPEEAE
jgi:hypothetical protein